MDDKILPFNSSETIVLLNKRIEEKNTEIEKLKIENQELKNKIALLQSTKDMLYLQAKRLVDIGLKQRETWVEAHKNFVEIKNKISEIK